MDLIQKTKEKVFTFYLMQPNGFHFLFDAT